MAKWGLQNLSDEALDDLERAGGDISKLGDSTLEEMEMWESAMAPKPKAPEVPAWQSAAMGAGNAMALGFGDEIAGVAGAITGKGYEKTRDSVRRAQDVAKADNPTAYTAGSVAGGLVPAVALPGSSSIAGAAAVGGGTSGAISLGESDELNRDSFTEALKDAGIGAAMAGTLQATMPAIFDAAKKYGRQGAEWLAQKFGSGAEQMAVNATGATRVQAEKFKPGVGRELLDRNIVRYGSDPSTIAKETRALQEQSGQKIDDILNLAGREGVEVDAGTIFDELVARSEALASNPAKKAQKAAIDRRIQDLLEQDTSTLTPQRSEAIKRGYDKAVNYHTKAAKPNTMAGVKDVAGAYRHGTEEALGNFKPELLDEFKGAKNTYGRMVDISKASESRALQQQQNPMGGLNDVAAVAAGRSLSPDVTAFGLLSVPIRRIYAKYGPSAIAKTADAISSVLQGTPGAFGKFEPALREAMKRGPEAVVITHQTLQSDPEYAALFGGSENDADGQ